MRKEKTESHVFSGFGNGISCGWERKSTTRRFATSRFWPCTWKISSDGKVQFNNWQFCILKIRPIICFWSDSTHPEYANAQSLFGDCRSFYFYLLIKSTFFVSEGLLCLYEKRVQLEEKFHIYARPSIILYVFILWNIDSIIVIYITHKLAFTLWKLTFPYTRIAL